MSIKAENMQSALQLLRDRYNNVRMEGDYLRVYDQDDVDGIVKHLIDNGITPSEIKKNKVGLEEYYIELMSNKGVN